MLKTEILLSCLSIEEFYSRIKIADNSVIDAEHSFDKGKNELQNTVYTVLSRV